MHILPELPDFSIRYVNEVNSSEESFIQHFSIAHAFEPFNLVKEITYRVDYPGFNFVAAHFPFGFNAFLKEKHPKGVIEMTNAIFEQFNNIILNHLKNHASLDSLKSMRLCLNDDDR